MQRFIALCLDDALAKQRILAEELNIPITFSVPTKFVGSSASFMTWHQLKGLAALHEIACHAHAHNSWNQPGFDVESDIKTALTLLNKHGITPNAFVPPRNEWIEHHVCRANFSCGRKGDGPLLPDIMRLKACGLSRLPLSQISYALEFNKPRRWAVYVAHLYRDDGADDPVFGDEWAVIRALVAHYKQEGAKFVTLSDIAEEFKKELAAIYDCCPICGNEIFEQYSSRPNARCTLCGALERHRDLAFLIDSGAIDVANKRGLLISSGEMLNVLQRNGANVTVISPFKEVPYNDVHDLSHLKNYDFAMLQHVLPFVRDHITAITSIMDALAPNGIIYANHPTNTRLATHELRKHAYGLHFSDNQWTQTILHLGLEMERFPILPGTDDHMFMITRKTA